jgi:hypothetical protein
LYIVVYTFKKKGEKEREEKKKPCGVTNLFSLYENCVTQSVHHTMQSTTSNLSRQKVELIRLILLSDPWSTEVEFWVLLETTETRETYYVKLSEEKIYYARNTNTSNFLAEPTAISARQVRVIIVWKKRIPSSKPMRRGSFCKIIQDSKV